MLSGSFDLIAYLRTPAAIRERCEVLFDLCLSGQLDTFTCDLSRLDRAVDLVLEVTHDRYPDLDIPLHSRWRHFDVGGSGSSELGTSGSSRLAQLERDLADDDAIALAKAEIDLVVTSVLLDAGAGAAWKYVEAETGRTLSRSEGLAVASFRAFCAGTFSACSDYPWRADAVTLQSLSRAALACAFQVTEDNPLVGLQGRLELMHRLGETVARQWPQAGLAARPGHILDDIGDRAITGMGGIKSVPAVTVFGMVLLRFGDIWPGRAAIAAENLGDVWPHPAIPGDGFVPFHKLSQWLTYSLVEPLAKAGIRVTDLDALTGLAEYRNGGLFVDTGVIVPRREDMLTRALLPGDPAIVAWRALTIALLDRVAERVRHRLNAFELPLANVLEGGTWHAGRRIAATLRPTGVPPIQLDSDGTVF